MEITTHGIFPMMSKSLMRMMIYWALMAGLMLIQQLSVVSAAYKDDACETKSQPGLCKGWSECPIIRTLIERGEYTKQEVVSCGFGIHENMICCPVIMTDMKTGVTPPTTVPSTGPVTTRNPTDRPAVRACQRIVKGLRKGFRAFFQGPPAEPGEFPHMVAIGYSRLGDDGQGPYDIRCGGTLIDSRFVLTAAHCVSARNSVPAIARMGVVNFTDPNTMEDAVEIRIKEIFIHDDYSQRRTYNDIAILELVEPAPLGEFIYPVCLYTDEADPEPEAMLWVTGWGTVNTSIRSYSGILLRVQLKMTSIENCNASFADYGLTRQIDQGIIKTQFCAEEKEQIRETCQGTSGGPLNLILDEVFKNYRLVGVVSSGFGCVSSSPGLYTRVAPFLNFIEKIVWPNGGD